MFNVVGFKGNRCVVFRFFQESRVRRSKLRHREVLNTKHPKGICRDHVVLVAFPLC